MYCPYCGSKIPNDASFCPVCGNNIASYHNDKSPNNYNADYNSDSGSIGWGILGFFVPLVGLILYLVWKDEKPKSAKMAGKGALISFMIYIVMLVIYIIFIVAFVGSAFSAIESISP